jgi:hypothetical protein
MSPSIKKLLAVFAMLLWLFIYALLVMRLGIAILPGAGGLATFLFYTVAGLAWIIPIGLALPWMHREPRQ